MINSTVQVLRADILQEYRVLNSLRTSYSKQRAKHNIENRVLPKHKKLYEEDDKREGVKDM